MKVAIVYEPDLELGPDPLDEAKEPRRLGDFIDSEKTDVLVVWREFGDQFEDGSRTHLVPGGSWENLTEGQLDQVVQWLNAGFADPDAASEGEDY